MKKTVLTYGFISGGIAAVLMLCTLPFMSNMDGNGGAIVGYTGIVLSMLLVFFGVRSYRENVGSGTISFGRAFSVGILITLISCTCYVATWELIYFKLAPEFGEKCLAAPVNKLKATGAPKEKIDEAQHELDKFKKLYDNPLANAAITYIEPFPVGLLISAVTALILRRKGPQTA